MERNPIIQLPNGDYAQLIGDSHLGKKFITGVPLHRRGDREKMQWKQFEELMNPPEHVSHIIMMGDLFDTRVVAPEVVLRAAKIIRDSYHHDTIARTIFIIRGNHDMSRNEEQSSSFDLLKHIVHDCARFVEGWSAHNGYALFGYHPFRTSEEMVADLAEELPGFKIEMAFGHWDVDSFGEMPHNMFPWESLTKLGVKTAYTGHVHKPEVRTYGELKLVISGSMQPFAFGEEVVPDLYQTTSLDLIEKTDGRFWKDRCVKVVLAEGEELPELDCLQLLKQRVGAPDTNEELTVDVASFDMRQIMMDCMLKMGVTDVDIRQEIFTEYDQLRADEASK